MKYIGFDCSLKHTGVAIMEDGKIIYTSGIKSDSKDRLPDRIAYIVEEAEAVVRLHNPDVIGIEDTFGGINILTTKKLSYLVGAMMYVLSKYDRKIVLIPPSTHKKTTTGKGNATKEITIKKVEQKLKVKIPYIYTKTGKIKTSKGKELKNDNIADACSICYYLQKGGVTNE